MANLTEEQKEHAMMNNTKPCHDCLKSLMYPTGTHYIDRPNYEIYKCYKCGVEREFKTELFDWSKIREGSE